MNPQHSEQPAGLPCREEFQALVKLANSGDTDALAKLRTLLAGHPEIWQSVGDLARHAQLNLTRLIARGDELVFESLQLKLAELRLELTGAVSTPLTALAVDRVVTAWLELQSADIKFPADAGDTLQMARYVVQLKTSAQRRFDAAIRSLVLVREKLGHEKLPELEIKLRRKRKILKFPMRKAE